ncbi:MAG: hypothetical protein R3326_05015 [Gemmatimonadota bacterium]|nr:hypothetical protein [Gemmatimonadota bacterium]
MGEIVYTSKVRIERKAGAVRHAFLPAEAAPVVFGVHGAVAEHYGVSEEEIDPRATTIDYVVAAAVG